MRNEAGPVCVVGGLSGIHADVRLDVEAAVRAEPLLGDVHDCPIADRSEAVRRAVQKLHVQHLFTAIHFPLRGGLAFRSLQARAAGLAFEDVRIIVHDDGTSRAAREAKQAWPAGPDDLILDFMESECLRLAPLGGLRFAARQPLVTVGIAHYNLGEFLPAALASLAKQTYPHLEVLVLDDGSTQAESLNALERLEREFPQVRFIRQANGGIGAARNRLLAEARGEYFLPMDADNLARPNMVEAFVRAMDRNPDLSAMTCWFRAFAENPDTPMYAYRPTGGPHALACIRNVYGDANGIFRTAEFRAAGGYETDRGTSCEDWEAYVKLVHAGKRIGVVPEYLFDYRHREAGFSRATNWFANHQRVLRQFEGAEWSALLGFQQENLRLREKLRSPQYRVADVLIAPMRWLKRRFGTGRVLPSGSP
jgi:glycosyltransferase involved in cell wall biosynthesis